MSGYFLSIVLHEYRLSLPKGEDRVRLRQLRLFSLGKPLTAILSPCAGGEADGAESHSRFV